MPQDFHRRLCDLMKARGHISTANRSGVDVNALAKISGTTYEMARRYVEGRAIPRAEKVDRIATWLGVAPHDLLYGETQHRTTHRIIHTEVLQKCIAAAQQAEQLSGQALPPEKKAKLIAFLYEEALDGQEVSAGLIPRLLRLI